MILGLWLYEILESEADLSPTANLIQHWLCLNYLNSLKTLTALPPHNPIVGAGWHSSLLTVLISRPKLPPLAFNIAH